MAAHVLTIAGTVWPRRREAEFVVTIFLTITSACGLIIALAHVVNRGFIALIDSVAANLTVFAFLLCLLLAQRTRIARRGKRPVPDQVAEPVGAFGTGVERSRSIADRNASERSFQLENCEKLGAAGESRTMPSGVAHERPAAVASATVPAVVTSVEVGVAEISSTSRWPESGSPMTRVGSTRARSAVSNGS